LRRSGATFCAAITSADRQVWRDSKRRLLADGR
jgi:hypothetical protein